MAIKIQNQELENKIIELYHQNNSIRKIGKELSTSTSYISRVLQDSGLYQYSNGNISQKRDFSCSDKEEWIAKHKVTGKEFNDYLNKSGKLAKYLVDINPNIIIPTGFKKRQLQKQTGKYWFEEYFDIVKITKSNIGDFKKCPYCEWTTIDLENKSGAFTSHLKDFHDVTISNYIQQFPDEIHLFKTQLNKLSKIEELHSSEKNYTHCMICNKKLSYITNTHLKKHGITTDEYKLKYADAKFSSENFIKKTTKNLIEANKTAIKKYVSKPEKGIITFLNENNITTNNTNRKLLSGVEIDIIIENYKIGIEFNGCKYHTELYGKKDRNFHLNKTKLMNEKSYKLIHIFEDEWELKNEIVKNKLLHIFKINPGNKIFARKCKIQFVENDIKNDFLNTNHIQGADKSNINLGCFYNDELIAIMTFDNIRQMNGQMNKNIYELKRFCTKNNTICIGAGGKLLNHFIKNFNPKTVISFADIRWTLDEGNNFYTKLGFKLVKKLYPDYHYYNNKVHRLKRYHKFQFGKNSLKKMFPLIYEDNKTEWEIMQEAGFDRIWDCGKFKYELDLSYLIKFQNI